MTTTPPKVISVVLITVFLTLSATFSAWSGVIRTTVTSSSKVTDSGDINLTMDIRNRGDVAANQVSVTLTLGDWVRRYPDLGENPPGGKIHLKDTVQNPGWNPGTYGCVVKVDFEDQNGQWHFARHFFSVRYLLKTRESFKRALLLRTIPPVFNERAFWVKKGNLSVTMENQGNETIRPSFRLFVPEGFATPETHREYALSGGETRTDSIPVYMESGGKNRSPFHLLVAYHLDGFHYSEFIGGRIGVEARPVFFKWYLVLGGGVLVIAFIFLWIRKSRIS